MLVVEHKTSGEDIAPGSDYWRRLRLDTQSSTYLVGATALGYTPRGVLYDVARRPALRPLKATPEGSRKRTKDGRLYAGQREVDETPDEYELRIVEDIVADPDKYFQRGLVVRLADEARAAAEDAWTVGRWIREAQLEADAGAGEAAWPRNPDSCHQYGSHCDYWAICSGQAEPTDPTLYEVGDRANAELSADTGKRKLPVLSTSAMKTFRACPRRYYMRYERRIRSLAVSDALRFGRLFHLGLEVWWQTLDVDAALVRMAAAESDPYELAKARALLRSYVARWGNEPLTVVGVETEFVAPLVNPRTGAASKTWELGGRIDALVLEPGDEAAA